VGIVETRLCGQKYRIYRGVEGGKIERKEHIEKRKKASSKE
jgi:hypothetical protein